MKTSNVIVLGLLGFWFLNQMNKQTVGGGVDTPGSFFQYPGSSDPIINPVSGSKFSSSVASTDSVSLDLKPRSFTSPSRFVGVTYDKGNTIGVLDRAAQQSVTVQEAMKRATNPFISALKSPFKLTGE